MGYQAPNNIIYKRIICEKAFINFRENHVKMFSKVRMYYKNSKGGKQKIFKLGEKLRNKKKFK